MVRNVFRLDDRKVSSIMIPRAEIVWLDSAALPADVLAALSATLTTTTARRLVFPYSFACPAGVLREGGLNTGCTEVMSPWGDAVAG